MREVLVRLEYKRRICRKRVMAHFTELDLRFFGVAVLVFFASLAAPASLPWMLLEVGGLVLIGIGLAFTIFLLPVALIFL